MNKRNESLVMKLAWDLSPYGDEWNSSAMMLEKELIARGINNIKLYYKYKLPKHARPVSYMIKQAVRNFYLGFYSLGLAKNLDVFLEHKVKDPDKREKIKQEVLEDIAQKQNFYKKEFADDYKRLLRLNPELPYTEESVFQNCVLDGAIFGFGPNEIKYMITDYKGYQGEIKELSEKIQSYGIKVGYVLAPETSKEIISALEKNKQSVMIEKNGRKIK